MTGLTCFQVLKNLLNSSHFHFFWGGKSLPNMNRYRKKAKQTFLFQSQVRSGWRFWHLRCAARISVKCDGRWMCFFSKETITVTIRATSSDTGAYHVGHAMTLDFESDNYTIWIWINPGGISFFPRNIFPIQKKHNEVGGGYLGLECAAALVGWGVWSLEKRQGASGPGSWFQCAVCICLCQPFDSCKVRFCWWAQEPSGYFRMLLPDTRISYSSHTSNMDQSGLISGQRDELWRVNSDPSKHVWSHGHL